MMATTVAELAGRGTKAVRSVGIGCHPFVSCGRENEVAWAVVTTMGGGGCEVGVGAGGDEAFGGRGGGRPKCGNASDKMHHIHRKWNGEGIISMPMIIILRADGVQPQLNIKRGLCHRPEARLRAHRRGSLSLAFGQPKFKDP